MVSFRDEESKLGPSRLHDSERWRQIRGYEHCMEGSEGSQRTLSGTYRSNSRIPGTGNSGRVEAQSHRIRKRQQVREAQDLERLDQRTHARNQHQARLQTRSRLDNPGEEPGLDPE